MDVQFTPEQEYRLAQIAYLEGIEPAQLVQDAALRLIEEDARLVEVTEGSLVISEL